MFSYCSMTKYTKIILYFNDLMFSDNHCEGDNYCAYKECLDWEKNQKIHFLCTKTKHFLCRYNICPLLHLNVLEQVNVQCHKH